MQHVNDKKDRQFTSKKDLDDESYRLLMKKELEMANKNNIKQGANNKQDVKYVMENCDR